MIKFNQEKTIWNVEANKYFERNKNFYIKNSKIDFPHFKIIKKILNMFKKNNKKISIAEIGSANGLLLKLLWKANKEVTFFAVDPSTKALSYLKRNIYGIRGTFNNSKLKKDSIDILIYGFCLYFSEKKDHKKIRKEALRILKKGGYIVIYDFYSKKFKSVTYKHDRRIKITKMDFSKIFKCKNLKLIYKNIIYLNKIKKQKNKRGIFVIKKK